MGGLLHDLVPLVGAVVSQPKCRAQCFANVMLISSAIMSIHHISEQMLVMRMMKKEMINDVYALNCMDIMTENCNNCIGTILRVNV